MRVEQSQFEQFTPTYAKQLINLLRFLTALQTEYSLISFLHV
jgi:hypothetical protein